MTECKYDDICGKAIIGTLKKVSAAAIPLSRNQVQQKGVTISNAAEIGDFVVVELTNDIDPWLLAEVEAKAFVFGGEEREGYMGTIKPNDHVIKVRRWLPQHNGGGSNIFQRTDSAILAFVEDVRLHLPKNQLSTTFKLQAVRRSGRTTAAQAAVQPKRVLDKDTKAAIVQTII